MATTLRYTAPHISATLETNSSYQFNTSLTPHSPISLHFRSNRPTRGMRSSTTTRAGPTSNQLIFAFVFPFSLLVVTAFTAFQIGNRLDQKFLDELAMSEKLREEEEDGDELGQAPASRKEEPALPKSRNRPKREI
ncbi:hypothetical protein RND81_10G076800 [Saponaria officinalis]|uniref:Transmembrane protein n=1 Tax=Saponaria officinalis TaxID=3572 RepID=A0AAW1I1J2_SAPOF